jgi:hypothetical protein
MFKRLSYATKNKLLIAGAILLLLLSWLFAFTKTYHAITLNKKLKQVAVEKNNLAYNPEYLKKKLTAINNILDKYSVDSTEWKNEFWLNISSLASKQSLDVIYQPENNLTITDSASNKLKQSIQFRGNYHNLIRLLDTLEKSKGLGRIVSARFVKEKKEFNDKGDEKIILTTDFQAASR